MIKTIYFVRLVANSEEFESLEHFFTDLGLDAAENWRGRHNRGVLFRTPQAGIEIGMGDQFPAVDILMQVADANSAYAIIRSRRYEIALEIADQPLARGCSSWNRYPAGKSRFSPGCRSINRIRRRRLWAHWMPGACASGWW